VNKKSKEELKDFLDYLVKNYTVQNWHVSDMDTPEYKEAVSHEEAFDFVVTELEEYFELKESEL
jgi:hypothetical protein